VFAVGMNGIAPEIRSLIEEWNGSSWNPVASPTPRKSSVLPSGDLNGVDCPTSTFCMAVGDYKTKKAQQTLVETWNGKNWKVQSSPNANSFSNTLTAVSCASSDYCVAIGDLLTPTARTIDLNCLPKCGTEPTGRSPRPQSTPVTLPTHSTPSHVRRLECVRQWVPFE
jgi:hypothetical protein